MADFKTHVTGSTILGIGYGVAAHMQFGVPVGHCVIAGALCSVAGMLPDLDSKTGIPQREMLCFVSVLIPMLMMFRFQELGFTAEQMVFVAGVSYVVIRFGLGELFKRFTKHRGMWHSIPAAAVAAMATYLVCFSPETSIRLFKAWAVFLGFILHLLLDELYSVDLMGRRLKKSWGTALKFFGKNKLANISTYAKVALLGFMIYSDGTFMDCCREQGFYNHAHSDHDDHDHDHQFSDHLPSFEPNIFRAYSKGPPIPHVVDLRVSLRFEMSKRAGLQTRSSCQSETVWPASARAAFSFAAYWPSLLPSIGVINPSNALLSDL